MSFALILALTLAFASTPILWGRGFSHRFNLLVTLNYCLLFHFSFVFSVCAFQKSSEQNAEQNEQFGAFSRFAHFNIFVMASREIIIWNILFLDATCGQLDFSGNAKCDN